MSDELSIDQFEKRSVDLVQSHMQDWVKMAEDVFGVYLDDEQKDVLRSCQFNKRTSVKSGTSRGKDFVSAVAAMCFMYSTPTWKANGEMDENTKVFLIAPTERQVADIMFPEISRLFNTAKIRGFNLPGRLVGLGIRTDWKEWFMTGFKADDHNVVAWTGLHAANILFIVTEASGMPQLVFDGIEGNLHSNCRLLIVFNDNTGTGYASDSQKKPGWAKFRLDCLNAPNVVRHEDIKKGLFKKIPGQVDWEGVNDKVKSECQIIHESDFKVEEGDFFWENENGRHCYRPNDLFRVKVRGLAPKVSSGVLVPGEWIEAANERWKLQQQQGWRIEGQLRLGNDVAGMGRDSSCFCPRFGNYVDKFKMIHSGGTANHMEVAGVGLNILKEHTDKVSGKYGQIFIDTIGEGAGVYSRLIELSQKKENDFLKDRVHSVKFSEGVVKDGKPLKDASGQYEFLNMRAWLYWAVRDWLNPDNNTGAMLPPDEELYQELSETKWEFMSNGKIKIEPKEDIKERIKRSPDKGDALANTFYPVPDFDPQKQPRKSAASYFA